MSVPGARDYGVVVGADGVLDDAATRTLREAMGSARSGPLPVFNFGPPIEELRRNSMAETGLPAPKAPVWSHIEKAMGNAAE